jgi:hypothetical protein
MRRIDPKPYLEVHERVEQARDAAEVAKTAATDGIKQAALETATLACDAAIVLVNSAFIVAAVSRNPRLAAGLLFIEAITGELAGIGAYNVCKDFNTGLAETLARGIKQLAGC